MDVEAKNLLILMSDEHAQKITGCYGHDFIHTPNLDRLADNGTVFRNAYSNAPICVPARAVFATGRYGHQTAHWDNATAYTGSPDSWGHVLQQNGNPVGSIGKLHYRNELDPVGFDFQELPMHLVDGVGDVLGCIRDPLPKRWKSRAVADQAGRGESGYTRYDRNITKAAVSWIQQRGKERKNGKQRGKPWTVFVSYVAPHFPLIAPNRFYDLYRHMDLMPRKAASDDDHEWIKRLRGCFIYDNFTEERLNVALTAYFGLISFMDSNIGQLLDALDDAGLAEETRIIYTSDHGDNMGERGLWGKSNLYEEAAAVPLLIAGADIPSGHACDTPVSLLDVFPTVTDCMGICASGNGRPGRSLLDIASAPSDSERVIFSEYHAAGAYTGAFMIRKGMWKYMYYLGLEPSLYDLENDPEEEDDLGTDPEFAAIRNQLHAHLLDICDPVKVDLCARRDQAQIVERHGGAAQVLARGGFGATPAPGEDAEFESAARGAGC